METVLDTLVVVLRADFAQLKEDIGRLDQEVGQIANVGQAAMGDLKELSVESVTLAETIDGALGTAVERLEGGFQRFLETGKFSFRELGQIAVGVLSDIASAFIESGIGNIFGQTGVGTGGFGGFSNIIGGLFANEQSGGGFFSSIITGLSDFLPAGRAIGGAVSDDRPFLIGERGPEIFFPSQGGRIEPLSTVTGDNRPRNITVNVNIANNAPNPMTRESVGQIALSVRRAVARAARDQ